MSCNNNNNNKNNNVMRRKYNNRSSFSGSAPTERRHTNTNDSYRNRPPAVGNNNNKNNKNNHYFRPNSPLRQQQQRDVGCGGPDSSSNNKNNNNNNNNNESPKYRFKRYRDRSNSCDEEHRRYRRKRPRRQRGGGGGQYRQPPPPLRGGTHHHYYESSTNEIAAQPPPPPQLQQQQQQQQHLFAEEAQRNHPHLAAAVLRPTAGIVSDDEEQLLAADPQSARTTTTRTTTTEREPIEQQQRLKPDRSPSSHHDDSVGHFQGGPGTIIDNRYRILEQVGLGTFGKVMECLDLRRAYNSDDNNHLPQQQQQQQQQQQHVAIKIVRSVRRYCESAKIEAEIVQQINKRRGRGITHCVILHQAFTYFGHYCLVFENLGPSLYDFMKQHHYQPFPMICIQDFAIQLLEAMEFLHSFRLVHTDLKIENILLRNRRELTYRQQRVPESTRIKLIDFGGACYDDSRTKSCVISTRQYRAPEVILEAGWSMPSDMWSVGCILAELYKGELLFQTHQNVEHLALIEHIIGSFPPKLLQKSTSQLVKDAFEYSTGRHLRSKVLSRESLAFVKHSPTLSDLVRNPDDAWFLQLLSDLLIISPEQRATARECLHYLNSIQRNRLQCAF